MADETKKNEGLACACGKIDLYEEWLKQNEDGKKEETLTLTSQSKNQTSSSNAASNVNTKSVPTKKMK